MYIYRMLGRVSVPLLVFVLTNYCITTSSKLDVAPWVIAGGITVLVAFAMWGAYLLDRKLRSLKPRNVYDEYEALASDLAKTKKILAKNIKEIGNKVDKQASNDLKYSKLAADASLLKTSVESLEKDKKELDSIQKQWERMYLSDLHSLVDESLAQGKLTLEFDGSSDLVKEFELSCITDTETLDTLRNTCAAIAKSIQLSIKEAAQRFNKVTGPIDRRQMIHVSIFLKEMIVDQADPEKNKKEALRVFALTSPTTRDNQKYQQYLWKGMGIAGQCMELDRPWFAPPNWDDYCELHEGDTRENCDFEEIVCIPIKQDDIILGVMSVDCRLENVLISKEAGHYSIGKLQFALRPACEVIALQVRKAWMKQIKLNEN